MITAGRIKNHTFYTYIWYLQMKTNYHQVYSVWATWMPGFLGSSHLLGVWRAVNIFIAQMRMLAKSNVTRRLTQTDRGIRGSQSQLALYLKFTQIIHLDILILSYTWMWKCSDFFLSSLVQVTFLAWPTEGSTVLPQFSSNHWVSGPIKDIFNSH